MQKKSDPSLGFRFYEIIAGNGVLTAGFCACGHPDCSTYIIQFCDYSLLLIKTKTNNFNYMDPAEAIEFARLQHQQIEEAKASIEPNHPGTTKEQ